MSSDPNANAPLRVRHVRQPDKTRTLCGVIPSGRPVDKQRPLCARCADEVLDLANTYRRLLPQQNYVTSSSGSNLWWHWSSVTVKPAEAAR